MTAVTSTCICLCGLTLVRVLRSARGLAPPDRHVSQDVRCFQPFCCVPGDVTRASFTLLCRVALPLRAAAPTKHKSNVRRASAPHQCFSTGISAMGVTRPSATDGTVGTSRVGRQTSSYVVGGSALVLRGSFASACAASCVIGATRSGRRASDPRRARSWIPTAGSSTDRRGTAATLRLRGGGAWSTYCTRVHEGSGFRE